jgi:hypothetical protein
MAQSVLYVSGLTAEESGSIPGNDTELLFCNTSTPALGPYPIRTEDVGVQA